MKRIKLTTAFIFISFFVAQNLGAQADSTNSLVISSSETSRSKRSSEEGAKTEINVTEPQIYQMHVKSKVSNRFAHTTVISKVKNLENKPQEATFSVILPEAAFISGFVMEVDGKTYTAYVKEKEEAKRTYDEAVASGLGAAHVAVSARDSNRFTVTVNVEPDTKATFYLSYEELLKRDNGHYELVINLHPGQLVKDLNVEVFITENRKITDLKAPPLRSGNEIGSNNAELDPRAHLEIVNDGAAVVRFTPDLERQKQLAHLLGTNETEGLAGQFVVQYDVERDPKGGEVLIQDGYFVHFFAPSELAPLPKHVVFVLDTSGSMYNTKIQQLKEAMHKILKQLHSKDLFSLVEFNSNVKVWDLNNADSSVSYPSNSDFYYHSNQPAVEEKLSNYTFPNAYSADADNIKKASETISKLTANGGTDIYTALKVGLHLVELGKEQNTDTINRQPLIIFLTDGDPTVGITSTEEILNKISEYNSGVRKAPIFALSFGDGANKNLLQKLALRNSGFSKHIYEAADASLQLQAFYRQISSPLLANVTFKYESSVTGLTKTDFPIHFEDSELVVVGLCSMTTTGCTCDSEVIAWNGLKYISVEPTEQQTTTSIERLWAYLTIKQLLEKKETSDEDKEELKQKVLDLALKYSFVTPVTSLVVVKPNATNAVDPEIAEERLQPATLNIAGGASYPGVAGYPRGPQPATINIAGEASYPGAPGLPGVPAIVDSLHDVVPPYSVESMSVTGDASRTRITAESLDLLSVLPWLNSILNENGTLTLPTGNYKLGLNETLSDIVACPNTPLNAAGHCTLLHSCPQVHPLLTSVDVFVNHFCELKNEYAGICCPDSPSP